MDPEGARSVLPVLTQPGRGVADLIDFGRADSLAILGINFIAYGAVGVLLCLLLCSRNSRIEGPRR